MNSRMKRLIRVFSHFSPRRFGHSSSLNFSKALCSVLPFASCFGLVPLIISSSRREAQALASARDSKDLVSLIPLRSTKTRKPVLVCVIDANCVPEVWENSVGFGFC